MSLSIKPESAARDVLRQAIANRNAAAARQAQGATAFQRACEVRDAAEAELARDEGAQAKAAFAAASEAHATLETEHNALEAAVSQAQGRVTQAIAALLRERGDAIGAELLAAKRRTWALEKQLGGLSVLWLRDDRGERLSTISPQAIAALNATVPSPTILASPANDAANLWSNWLGVLMHDADAEAPA